MRTTITVDDELVADIQELSGVDDRADAMRHAMRKYVQFEAARRVALMGGTMPGFKAAPRRRPPHFVNPE